MILKAFTELYKKMDKLIAYIKSSTMGVKDRCSDNIDTSSFTFPLKTLGELRTFEPALKELKFRDQFVSCNRCLKTFYVTRLSEIVCYDPWKSTKACLDYVLTSELAITYTLNGTKSKLVISNYRFYRTNRIKFTSQY